MSAQNMMDWQITVSGGCKTFKGPEIIATLSSKLTHRQAGVERDRLAKECGRILYLSKVCDSLEVK